MPLPRGPKVVIGFHDWGFVTSKFFTSVVHTLSYEGRRIHGVLSVTSPYVTEARNRLVHKFLESDAKYLLMVDADIEFPEDSISSCLYLAEANNIPVLAGDYALGSMGHSIFAKDPNSEMCQPLGNLEPNSLYRGIYAAGTGWLFINRVVLEKMKEAYPGPWHWFDHDPKEVTLACSEGLHPDIKTALEIGPGGFNSGGWMKMGEDLSFCSRAHKLGFEIAGLTGLRLIHHKQKGFVSEELKALFVGVDHVLALPNPYLHLREVPKEGAPTGSGEPVSEGVAHEAGRVGGEGLEGAGRVQVGSGAGAGPDGVLGGLAPGSGNGSARSAAGAKGRRGRPAAKRASA